MVAPSPPRIARQLAQKKTRSYILLSPYLWSLPVYVYFRKEHLVEVIIQTTAVPLEAQIAADLAAGAVLLEVAAHPAAGNSTIKNASPEAGIFKSDKVSLMPGL
ncbi:TPA: hypothetical protein IF817_000624 [Escherichia coli]|nr:hypothetical protein [Escherichia coli]